MAVKPWRIITAVAAYDGHDASILALNRALLASPAPVELIYLGYHMTAEKIALAASQEGADAIAVASYNGGHLSFYPQLLKLLQQLTPSPLLFGGGGATILPREQQDLEAAGIDRIYLPGVSLAETATDMLVRLKQRQTGPGIDPVSIITAAIRNETGALARLAHTLAVSTKPGLDPFL